MEFLLHSPCVCFIILFFIRHLFIIFLSHFFKLWIHVKSLGNGFCFTNCIGNYTFSGGFNLLDETFMCVKDRSIMILFSWRSLLTISIRRSSLHQKQVIEINSTFLVFFDILWVSVLISALELTLFIRQVSAFIIPSRYLKISATASCFADHLVSHCLFRETRIFSSNTFHLMVDTTKNEKRKFTVPNYVTSLCVTLLALTLTVYHMVQNTQSSSILANDTESLHIYCILLPLS